MRTDLLRATIAGTLTLGLCVAAGCGQRYELPPQPEPTRISTPGTYNLQTVWGVPSPTDMVLYGSYLYVIEGRQKLGVYLSQKVNPQPPSVIGEFTGLGAPVLVALAKGESTYVFVADAQDMTIKRYYFRGGAPRFSFSDTLWTEFSGLAADPDLDVYVSSAGEDLVVKYDRYGRRVRVVSSDGAGLGYVSRPHGLAYAKQALWVSDTGKNWVQRLYPDSTNRAFPGNPIGMQSEVEEPFDVAVNPSGDAVFVAETGADRITRFQITGGLDDIVYAPNKAETMVDPPLQAPRYVAADDDLVFVSDEAHNRIVVLRFARQ